MRTFLAVFLAGFALCGLTVADEPVPCCGQEQFVAVQAGEKKDDKKNPRGLKIDHVKRAHLHQQAIRRHGARMAALPEATAPKYDCREFGYVPAIDNQGSCGSCYLVSSAWICSAAFIKAGYAKNDGSFKISPQYGMDCRNFGGCGGGDEAQVIDWIKQYGFPLEKDYAPYDAQPERCRVKPGTKFYKINDWGFCTPGQQWGVANTQDIKNAMVQYGPISIAVSADGWDSYSGGVFTGNSRNVDHAVKLIGWDDSKGKNGAWLLANQWGTGWGEKGLMWIAYGANAVGTEAIWVSVIPVGPPPPPTPGAMTVTVADVSGAVNAAVTVKPVVSGGTGPYTFAVAWGDGGQYEDKLTHTYAAVGTYAITVVAADSAGKTAVGTCTAVIGDTPPPGPAPTPRFPMLYKLLHKLFPNMPTKTKE